MRYPCIGLTGNEDVLRGPGSLRRQYLAAVERAGGVPLLLPAISELERLPDLLARLDGLILTGGGDVDPAYFGERPIPQLGEVRPVRDAFELALTRLALAAGHPLLAICRGLQVLNVAAGGSLYQDLPSQRPGPVRHRQLAPRFYPTHPVKVEPGSRLAGLAGGEALRVNSFHHQAVKAVAPGLKITAIAADGVVEALEGDSGFLLAVQWHPEDLTHLAPHAALFRALVAAARR